MSSVTFDTLKFVETLRSAGFDESQAKGMAAAIREVQQSHLDELATRRDMRELELTLENRLAATKVDIIRWVVATGIVILGGVAALYRLAPPAMVYPAIPSAMEAPAHPVSPQPVEKHPARP